MNNSQKLTAILKERQTAPPPDLRANIALAMEKELKKQTFKDDVKWLGLCLGFFLVVLGRLWLLLYSADKQLEKFSDSAIASTEIRLPR